MIDEVPLTEVVSSASATALVAGFASFYRHGTRHLLLIWACTASIVLVALNHATAGLLPVVAVTAATRFGLRRPLRLAFLAAGLFVAVLVLTRNLQTGLQVGALITAATASLLFWRTHCSFGQTTTTILIAGSALGIYVNVPDTEQIVVYAAGLVVLAAAMLVLQRISVGPVWFGSLALVAALVVCAGATGARGRPASFVGVVGVLGVFLAEPAANVLRRDTRAHVPVLIAIHACAVIVSSRVAGIRDYAEASLIVVGCFVGAVVLLAALPRSPIGRPQLDA